MRPPTNFVIGSPRGSWGHFLILGGSICLGGGGGPTNDMQHYRTFPVRTCCYFRSNCTLNTISSNHTEPLRVCHSCDRFRILEAPRLTCEMWRRRKVLFKLAENCMFTGLWWEHGLVSWCHNAKPVTRNCDHQHLWKGCDFQKYSPRLPAEKRFGTSRPPPPHRLEGSHLSAARSFRGATFFVQAGSLLRHFLHGELRLNRMCSSRQHSNKPCLTFRA